MFHFPGQREEEEVKMVIRKHPIVFFKIILVFILAILVPLVLFLIVWFNQYPLGEYSQRGLAVYIFASMYLLYGLLFSCVAWINDEFDIFILTDERLIDITQVSLFHRSVTSTPLSHIQDATSQINGFLQTLLNYGDVTIQTASGSATDIHIDKVPRPGEVARDIMNVAHINRKKGEQAPYESSSDGLTQQ